MEVRTFIFNLFTILITAKLCGEVAERIKQPAVLGELVGGIIIGGSVLGLIKLDETIHLLAEVGVIILLFEIGLESDLDEFLNVGKESLIVACVGVATPFLLGYIVMKLMGLFSLQAIFIGATLTATSVGITARVLSDLGKLPTKEARIILGAAVIDDILGLIILSIMIDLSKTGTVSFMSIAKVVILSVSFLTATIIIGRTYAQKILIIIEDIRVRGIFIVSALSFALILSYLADISGTSLIVGAFAAGIVLSGTQHQEMILGRLKPLADIFTPVFFIVIGAKTDLGIFNPFVPENYPIMKIAGLLVLVGCLGKIASGLSMWAKDIRRIIIGVGMIPRGEVGFIFASIGLSSAILSQELYSAVIIMVVISTFIVPPWLKILYRSEVKNEIER